MSSPFFSIVVSCCDVEPYVRESLDSVLGQPFADWECLVGVETSKDKTEEIVREYAAKDPRFRMFTGPRSGSCSASRNTGTDMAQGEYVIFLDGDDTIAEGSLQRLHDKIAARPGADLYPCAIQVHNDITGKDENLRDNYPADFNGELTGPEAVLSTLRRLKDPCPMLQLTVFRRQYLVVENLKCIHGLRRQDSEFTPVPHPGKLRVGVRCEGRRLSQGLRHHHPVASELPRHPFERAEVRSAPLVLLGTAMARLAVLFLVRSP